MGQISPRFLVMKFVFLLSAVAAVNALVLDRTVTGSGASCIANDGPAAGSACVFPFNFRGVSHSECTTIDGDPRPWCSTQTDANDNHVSGIEAWGYCPAGSCSGKNSTAGDIASGCFTWGYNDICRIKSGEIIKVKLGYVLPRKSPSKIWEFNLCQNEKCVPIRGFATYGSNHPGYLANPIPPLGTKDYRLREYDFTHLMIEHNFDPDKPLTAEMTKETKSFANKYWDLPEPVVMMRPHPRDNGKKGKVFLNPNEDRSHYADLLDGLLDEFTIIY